MSVPSPSAELRPRLSSAAVASLVLGLSLVGAIPACFVGLRAIRSINASDGRLRGLPLAVAGLVLGAAGTAVTVVLLVLLVLRHLNVERDRVECVNNLRRIGLAVHQYYTHHNKLYPPATVAAPDLPPEKRLSWYASILPDMEHNPKARAWAPLLNPDVAWDVPPNAPAAHARLAVFLCPSTRSLGPHEPPGVTSYRGLAGVDPDAVRLPKTSPRAGFFGYDRVISLDDDRRGSSETMMVAESDRDLGPWVAGGPSTVRGLDPNETTYLGVGRPFGGLHPGGANTLWVDGTVHVLPNNISPIVFRLHATLGEGGE
jgi:prepilin-type processing-associated H-X9-DG protein